MSYTELQVTTNFSFLRGASHPEEVVAQAASFGYQQIAITDVNTLAGIVRAHIEAKKHGISIIPACHLKLEDGPDLLMFPTDLKAYTRLSGLLTTGNLRTEKGKCLLYKQDVYEHAEGSLFIVLPPRLNETFDFPSSFLQEIKEYRQHLGDSLHIAASCSYDGNDAKKRHRIAQLANSLKISMVATNDVHYHHPRRRELQDIVTCVREKCTIHTAGFRLHPNAERYLKPQEEMLRLFRQYPQAIQQTQTIAEACTFSLDQLKYKYPKEVTSEERSPQEELTHQVWKGAKEIYKNNIPDKIKGNINYELKFIDKKEYAEYFLTVFDIVKYARSQDILCQGRGSAANSTVCYCLGITSVDPTKFDLLFERFISDARNEPPDIDVDFEHERREEVMQYIYNKYGRDRAAVVATVTQLRHKGAIRDVGKAMGLSVDIITRLSSLIWSFKKEGFDREYILSQGINPDDPTIRKVLELTGQFISFPRQLGQHTGGFVITQEKLSDLCPVLNARMDNRTNIEWNKDDIEALGFLKIDILALGMLTCIRKAFTLTEEHYNQKFTLATVPQQDDPKVYETISQADTIGVFQIESRAQMSMLPRLRPKCFYDLVIEVAIVRPGPIQGDMVHPYLKRRSGEEPVEYPSKELEDILKRTLGVPLFQEQAMKIAVVAAGFTTHEADELRRSMATFKAKGKVSYFKDKFIKGMTNKNYSLEYAQRVFRQIEGFGSYGFPESHAVSFALLAYVSSWIKCYYPDVFACSLLNSMPMGFYQPAQIITDARKHGVVVRPIDINHSLWDNTLEEKDGAYFALRLGFRQAKGIHEGDINRIIQHRKSPYKSIEQMRALGILDSTLERLADADAFRSMGLDRRQALWEISTKDHHPMTLFSADALNAEYEQSITLPHMQLSEHVMHDYASTSLSIKGHPVSFIRDQLNSLQVKPTTSLKDTKPGTHVKVAGLVLVRQRPGTASGICFITVEDEFGITNLVVFEKLFDKYRKEIIQSRLLMVEGQLQREKEVIHVVAKRCYNLNRLLQKTFSNKRDTQNTSAAGSNPTRIIPEGRNFK